MAAAAGGAGGDAPAAGGAGHQRRLTIRHTRTLKMTDDVLCVRVSPDGAPQSCARLGSVHAVGWCASVGERVFCRPAGKLLAVALLDCTIKVFFLDSLRFFLSLYGHKLPVLSFCPAALRDMPIYVMHRFVSKRLAPLFSVELKVALSGYRINNNQ